MQALGKVKSPISGKYEKNLDQAKQAIDILEMIKEKTKGNLTEEENQAIETFLSEMRSHYVKESNKN